MNSTYTVQTFLQNIDIDLHVGTSKFVQVDIKWLKLDNSVVVYARTSKAIFTIKL